MFNQDIMYFFSQSHIKNSPILAYETLTLLIVFKNSVDTFIMEQFFF